MSKRMIAIGVGSAALIALLVWLALPKTKAPNPGSMSITSAPQASPATGPPPPDALQQTVDGIVARYRKTIVLLEDDASLSDSEKEKASVVGKIIFQENHEAIASLSNDLTAEIQNATDF